jgi:hypothetical protein
LSGLLEVIVETRAEYREKILSARSVQKEGVIVRCLFKAHIESNPILRVLACPQQKCDVLAFPHQCLQ